MLRDVPLDRRQAQTRFVSSPHFVIPLCCTLVFPLSNKHVPWVDRLWSRHNVKYDFTSHRWLDEGEPTTGGGKVNANMDGFGYGEAEELQTRQEVRLLNGICVVWYLLYRQRQQHQVRQVDSLHVSVAPPQLWWKPYVVDERTDGAEYQFRLNLKTRTTIWPSSTLNIVRTIERKYGFWPWARACSVRSVCWADIDDADAMSI